MIGCLSFMIVSLQIRSPLSLPPEFMYHALR